MDLNKIKELINLVEETGITGLVVEEGSLKIEIKNDPQPTVVAAMPAVVPQANNLTATNTAGEKKLEEEFNDLLPITSPMTGTFYASPDPESPSFINKGTFVDVGQPVCIIEAMKTFNEIEAEISGTVEKVMVKNQQAVEEGQVLFLVRP